MVKICSPLKPDFKAVEKYLQEGLDSGILSNFGPTYSKFVESLTDFLFLAPDKEIVLVSSGHTALMAAYAALGVKKIVVPDYTFESTRCAATLQGIEVLVCDVCLDTGCIDVEHLEGMDLTDVDAIVAVTALSNIPDLEALEDFCCARGKKLIIDGAASFGTFGISNYGDAFCLSFHATKTLGIGEGGAVICSSELAKKIRQYINFGFDEHKNVCLNGMNGKISEYSCAIGLSLLDQIDFSVAFRLTNASLYRQSLSDYCFTENTDNIVYQTFPVFAKNSFDAAQARKALRENGIETLQYYKPLIGLENSKRLYETNLCLPVHQGACSDIQTICKILKSI